MRKSYFIIFGVALVILILLVDWREKFDAIIGRKDQPENLLGRLQPVANTEQPLPEDSSLASVLDDELNETTAAAAAPELGWEQNALSPSFPTAPRRRTPPTGNGLARPNPADDFTAASPGLRQNPPVSPRFQDVPEQPYLDESRQLLRQMARNYDRIISGNAKTSNPNPQP